MAFYDGFEIRKIGKDGRVYYRVRYLDTYEIESWEGIDEELTQIFTKGGDSFVAKINTEELKIMCMAQNDKYGRLFTFYPN
jgi:hypothetical protein